MEMEKLTVQEFKRMISRSSNIRMFTIVDIFGGFKPLNRNLFGSRPRERVSGGCDQDFLFSSVRTRKRFADIAQPA